MRLRNFAKFEPCSGFTVQIISVLVKKPARKGPLQVCLLSPHPLVLSEFERVLVNPAFKLVSRHLESTLGPDLRHLQVPRAVIYVVDSSETYSLLQLGAKGLLTYDEAREQLPHALPLVASGGFWVPRAVLSAFVDSILGGSRSRRLKADTSADLSRREQEVLNSLLENLANKEIGNKLNISERTVKFHVSNLLSKFGVRRRADLILLCYQKRSAAP